MDPKIFETSFRCPNCGVVAHQFWYNARASRYAHGKGAFVDIVGEINADHKLKRSTAESAAFVDGLFYSECGHCRHVAVWAKGAIVIPKTAAGTPHPDMPESAALDFREAAAIAQDSPRGAAALLRLALEKLCHEIGDPSKKIDTNIATFVANGLNSNVTNAMDSLRVIGNEAVHPGEMDLRDDLETVKSLFQLLNYIVENVITQPNQIAALFDSLPEAKKQGIENRDKKNAKE